MSCTGSGVIVFSLSPFLDCNSVFRWNLLVSIDFPAGFDVPSQWSKRIVLDRYVPIHDPTESKSDKMAGKSWMVFSDAFSSIHSVRWLPKL